MALWLKCGPAELAFDHDIVPRESMQRLVQCEEIARAAQDASDALLAATADEAHGRLEAARAQADALAAKASRDATAVTRLAFAQGRRDGLRHWHAEDSARRQAAAATYGTQREHLADMVVQATASLMGGATLAAYLDTALDALDRLAERDMTLSVSVHPDDRPVAQAAVERLQPKWRDGTVVKLVEVATLARGSCICESPQGYVDASLSLQLATLRQAALGALQGLRLPDDIAAPPEPAAVAPVPVAPFPAHQPQLRPEPDAGFDPELYGMRGLGFPADGLRGDEDDDDDPFDDGFGDDDDHEPDDGTDGPPPVRPGRAW